MKTFDQFIEQITPPGQTSAVVGTDGKVRKFVHPIDTRTIDKKIEGLNNRIRK